MFFLWGIFHLSLQRSPTDPLALWARSGYRVFLSGWVLTVWGKKNKEKVSRHAWRCQATHRFALSGPPTPQPNPTPQATWREQAAMKNDIRFIPSLISLSGQRKTCHHTKRNHSPVSETTAQWRTEEQLAVRRVSRTHLIWFRLFLTLVLCFLRSTFGFDWLRVTVIIRSRSADRNTHWVVLFFNTEQPHDAAQRSTMMSMTWGWGGCFIFVHKMLKMDPSYP